MKKYIAKTNVSINVLLPTGQNRHISFSALTGGGSVFYTDDKEIQEAMERHYKYGTLFRLERTFAPEKEKNKPAPKAKIKAEEKVKESTPAPMPTESVESPETEEPETPAEPEAKVGEADEESDSDAEGEDSGVKKIVISDADAAKAYLAEHFSISRTKLKSLKAIKEAAAANGIEFEGL